MPTDDVDVNRTNKLLDVLFKWGYESALSWNYKQGDTKTFNHCKRNNIHKDHLHVQSYKPIIKKN